MSWEEISALILSSSASISLFEENFESIGIKIGKARRMQVAQPEYQKDIMIEAVENHTPEVIVVDEIGTEAEAQAARTIAERGVMLIATAHGNSLEEIKKFAKVINGEANRMDRIVADLLQLSRFDYKKNVWDRNKLNIDENIKIRWKKPKHHQKNAKNISKFIQKIT